ncbi:hypothetical protein FF011L_48210 [Roseimaritima multifibrata]|uniref:Uncharacterized protein n=1 Tax=Roseimaritima multifibrata TaxID=1930274 RepID=A0A517MML0_9BACT|nr:hypothetical protein [Roseimaritima multifibrata]QDS96017.1 hypothetical protein FF011L_48210 [Roseimaritima multifibrata]
MNPITSTQGGSSPYVNQAASGSQRAGGGDPAERLEKSLTSFLTEQKVSTEDQTKIQTELKDAVAALANSTSLTPQKVKDALSEVLTEHGIDGDSFVSQLGTPASQGSQTQSGQSSASGEGPRGGGGPRRAGGPPPGGGPPPTSDDTETSETTETSAASEIDALLEWLEEQSGTSSTSSSSRVDTFPDSFIKRGGGNLDATT